jgi:hypothetical protein
MKPNSDCIEKNGITKKYVFQPQIIDIAVHTFKENFPSSDFMRSLYIVSGSYHNL